MNLSLVKFTEMIFKNCLKFELAFNNDKNNKNKYISRYITVFFLQTQNKDNSTSIHKIDMF